MDRILVAEDEKNLLENISFLLRKSGYEVDAVSNGLEAMEKYQENKYSLIISDISMPYMDGIQLYSNIKNESNIEMIPFIFLSARADRESVRSCMEMGADDYITKPFLARELLNAVKTRLKKNNLIKKSQSVDYLKTEFLSQMSHEVRTPLHAINSMISLFNERVESLDQKQIEEVLKIIKSSSSRLTEMVESLILISEIRSGLFKTEAEDINLRNDILFSLLDENFSQTISEKEILIELHLDSTNDIIYSDFSSCSRIVRTVIDNAVKFTSKGKINVTTVNIDDKLKLVIEDTGIGINEDFLDKIFDPFAQEESGYTRRFEGAGIGLTLCAELCKINNIDIDIKSEKDKGTKVELLFISSSSDNSKSGNFEVNTN